MKKFLLAIAVLISLISGICSANEIPNSMDKSQAARSSRVSFIMNSVEGAAFDVYIVGFNEHLLGRDSYNWETGDQIFTADYRAYLSRVNDSRVTLQDVKLFGLSRIPGGKINRSKYDGSGIYIVKGKHGLSDLLVSTVMATATGFFNAKVFVIRENELKLVRFMSADDNLTRDESFVSHNRMEYLDDGTLRVPWWTNAGTREERGNYETIYMLDVQNLVLISSYTNKLPRN